MLSSSTTSTPRRPKPPAKARKSSPLNFAPFAPPPPYPGPLEEVLLDSPIPVTAQLINAATSKAEGIGLPGTPGIEDWMNEKSREELSGLLLKADGLIKSRETELGLTSALCKSLYTDNVTLKSKHEALLARLPGTRSSTPSNSLPTSPLRLEAPALEHSPSYPVVFPGSPTEANHSLTIPTRLRRVRRVSVTPGELSMLADQNAELIDKLEKLEDESGRADQAGKRKLRKLEQEIQTLREELESTQARGVELEEQAKAATQAVAVQKRKEEREARLQALKRSTTGPPSSDVPEEEVKDFAPPSWLPSRSSPITRSVSASTSASTYSVGSDRAYEHALGIAPMAEEDLMDEELESYFRKSQAHGSDRHHSPQAEFAIVSQLLAKIGELEHTNSEIKEQQRLTEERRRAVQWDADSIRRVYDWLDEDDVDLEIQDEDEACPPSASRLGVSDVNGTIRFSSIRRTIVGDMQRLRSSESDIFAEGILKEMQSTVSKSSAPSKARKTVVGLFDQDPDTSGGSSSWGQYPPSLEVSPAFRSLDRDISRWSSAATDGLAPLSPTTSTLQTPLEGPLMGRTLGSELGSEFGDDWAERGINHHLRASSLADLAGLYSSPGSPNESLAALPSITFPDPSEERSQEQWNRAGPSTPPPAPKLQVNVEPPTPTPEKLLRSPLVMRQLRLSQTVRSRTNRWVEGRFQFPEQQKSLSEASPGKRPLSLTLGPKSTTDLLSKTAPNILSETFDNAVGQIKRGASRGSFAPLGFGAVSASSKAVPASPQGEQTGAREDEDEHMFEEHEGDRSVSLRPDASMVDSQDNHHGIVRLVLEAWLWLQFIIVVALFLWAMAKRGPKVVLEAERRGAHRAVSKP